MMMSGSGSGCANTKTENIYRILDSHTGGYEEFHLLGYNTMYSTENRPAFYVLHVGFLLDLFFDPEDEGDMLL
jgi:hypothetical protein